MATIKDVAKLAQVSPSTVSRILNEDPTLSTSLETKKKVINAAKELKYNKSKKMSKAIFTLEIIQWFSEQQEAKDNYYLQVRKGIEDFCVKNCINVVRTFKSNPNYLEQIEDADGIICIGKFSDEEVEKFMSITKNIVFLDMSFHDYKATTFSLDFEMAVNEALTYLIELGHKEIAFLGGREFLGEENNNVVYEDYRKKAFIKFCEKNEIDYNKYLIEGRYSMESGYQMMNEILEKKQLPTAVFAASDQIAFGAMKAIREHDLNIPEDISLIGFDDLEMTRYTAPALTTLHAPAYEMGQYGVNSLFAASNLAIKTTIKVKLPCHLVVRDSCMAINE